MVIFYYLIKFKYYQKYIENLFEFTRVKNRRNKVLVYGISIFKFYTACLKKLIKCMQNFSSIEKFFELLNNNKTNRYIFLCFQHAIISMDIIFNVDKSIWDFLWFGASAFTKYREKYNITHKIFWGIFAARHVLSLCGGKPDPWI